MALAVEPQNGVIILNNEWKTGDVVKIEFKAEVEVSYWYHRGAAVERGPLLYALKMEEKWVRCEVPEADRRILGKEYYEVYSSTPWNWGFSTKALDEKVLHKTLTFERTGEVSNYPWNVESAPMSIKAKVHKMLNWKEYNGSTGPVSFITTSNTEDASKEIYEVELIPFGCTTLRIALFPTRPIKLTKEWELY